MAINTIIEQYPADKIPNKETQDKYTFAENVYGYLNYFNGKFVPQTNNLVTELNDTLDFFTDDFINSVKNINDNLEDIKNTYSKINYIIDVSNHINSVSTVATSIDNVNTCATNITSINDVSSNLPVITEVSNNIAYVTDVGFHIDDIKKLADNLEEVLNKTDLVLSLSNYRAVYATVTKLTGLLIIYEYDLNLEIDENGNLTLNDDTIDMELNSNGELIYFKE